MTAVVPDSVSPIGLDERTTSQRVAEGSSHRSILVGSVAEMGVSLVASALVARLLLPYGRGELGRWIYWAQIMGYVGALSINTALPQLVGARQLDRAAARRVASFLSLVTAPLIMLSAFALAKLASGSDPSQSAGRAGWWWTGLGFAPAFVVSAAAQGLLIADKRGGVMMLVRVLGRVVYVAAIAALMLFGEHRASVVAAANAATWIVTATSLYLVARPLGPAFDTKQVRVVLRRGLANYVTMILMVAIGCLDQGWVFTKMLNADAGLFATAIGVSQLLEVLSFAEISASTVAMSEPNNGWPGARRALLRTSGLAAAGYAAGYLLSPVLIPLIYGTAFTSSVPIFRILLAGSACYVVGRVAESALQCAGRSKLAWILQISRGSFLVLFMISFGARGGLHGVAWASSMASLVSSTIVVAVVLRTLRGRRATH
jgi:antigen flippase